MVDYDHAPTYTAEQLAAEGLSGIGLSTPRRLLLHQHLLCHHTRLLVPIRLCLII